MAMTTGTSMDVNPVTMDSSTVSPHLVQQQRYVQAPGMQQQGYVHPQSGMQVQLQARTQQQEYVQPLIRPPAGFIQPQQGYVQPQPAVQNVQHQQQWGMHQPQLAVYQQVQPGMQQQGYAQPYVYHPQVHPPPAVSMAVAFPELLMRPPPVGTYQMPEGDLQETVLWLRNLCSRTERAVDEVRRITGLQPSSRAQMVFCPFDPCHSMPPDALLPHWLRCPSSAAGISEEEAARLVSSLSYLRPDDDEVVKEGLLSSSSNAKVWYEGAPGPVVLACKQDAEPDLSLPSCIADALLKEPVVQENPRELLLPSDFWLLSREVEEWLDIPKTYSWNVLVSATALDRLEKGGLTEWLLAHSCEHGIVLDPVLATHIFVLLKPLLRVGSKEAAAGLASGCKSGTFECPVLHEAGKWLTRQLTGLYHPPQAAAFTIRLLKHAFIVSARSMLANGLDNRQDEVQGGSGDAEELSFSSFQKAIRALHERKELEILVSSRVRSRNGIKPEEFGNIVRLAAEERSSRPNYRPVLEHDGLVWHRDKEENSKSKIKTSSDLLAAERDYKRRPLSYKGKKVKRSASQVIHDIIERQMTEIVAAGGIGCLGKSYPAIEAAEQNMKSTRDGPIAAEDGNRKSERKDQFKGDYRDRSRDGRRRSSTDTGDHKSEREDEPRAEHNSRSDPRDRSTIAAGCYKSDRRTDNKSERDRRPKSERKGEYKRHSTRRGRSPERSRTDSDDGHRSSRKRRRS